MFRLNEKKNYLSLHKVLARSRLSTGQYGMRWAIELKKQNNRQWLWKSWCRVVIRCSSLFPILKRKTHPFGTLSNKERKSKSPSVSSNLVFGWNFSLIFPSEFQSTLSLFFVQMRVEIESRNSHHKFIPTWKHISSTSQMNFISNLFQFNSNARAVKIQLSVFFNILQHRKTQKKL